MAQNDMLNKYKVCTEQFCASCAAIKSIKVNKHDRQRTHAFAAYHALNARLLSIHEMQPLFSAHN